MLLDVKDLNVYYGAIHALQGISFTVNEGEIVTLIGANGAGKSTTLRTISGLLRPRRGSVVFKDEDITMTPAEQIVRRGIVHVPEGRKIFAPMTVRENLEMGAYTRTDPAEIQQSMERGFASFPRLKERLNQLGGTLSGGEQQMLAMARGDDEPSGAPAAGRALHGSEPDHDGRNLPHHSRRSTRREPASCWSSRML